MVDRASSRAGEAGAGAELSMEDMCRALLIVRSKGNLKKKFLSDYIFDEVRLFML